MGKGEKTRAHIVHEAAVLFNQRGYSGASMADIMNATGLQKGGIYRHFATKEALAVAAFDHAVDRMSETLAGVISKHDDAIDRLQMITNMYAEQRGHADIPGGCPIMNTAIETDDGNPLLREHARHAMDRFRAFIRRIVAKGQTRKQVRPELDPDQVATIFIGGIEGALMLANLYKDAIHLRRMRQHLDRYLEEHVRSG